MMDQQEKDEDVIAVMMLDGVGVLATVAKSDGEIEFEDGARRQIVAVLDFMGGDPNKPQAYVTFDATDYVTEPYQALYTLTEQDGTPGLALGKPQGTRAGVIEELFKVYGKHLQDQLDADEDEGGETPP